MHFDSILASSAVWLFLFRKLATWSWFQGVRRRFPGPLETLWAGWTSCPYCGAFWVALLIRAATHRRTLVASAGTPLPLDWFLDALSTGFGVLIAIRVLDALVMMARSADEKAG